MADQPLLDIQALCAETGVSPRTVHFYVQQGLLKPVGTRGPRAKYDRGHVVRLRLIREMQRNHVPLAEIRTRLGGMSDEAAEAMLAAVKPDRRGSAGTALEYVRRVLGVRPAAPGQPGRGTGAAAVAAISAVPPHPASGSAGARTQWDRIVLAPGVELHVCRPQSRYQNRKIERLLGAARQIFDEVEP